MCFFNPSGSYKKGQSEYFRRYYQKHRDKLIQRSKEWYWKNKSKASKNGHQRYKTYKKRWLKITKDYYGEIQCQKCGYDKCFESMDFHHKNPKEKGHVFWKLLIKNPTPKNVEIFKRELEKCDLICKNCHGEVHYL